MYQHKYLILLFLLFSSINLNAQRGSTDIDITGLWKGTLYNDSTRKYYRYEIGISEEKGRLSGFSHTFFLVEDKQYYGVKKVKVKRMDGKIIIEDDGLIANNYPEAPAKGVRQLNVLTLEIEDSVMKLTGPFSTNRTKVYSPLTGSISLQRRNDFWQSALVPHLQELGRSEQLSFVKKEIEITRAAEAKQKEDQEIAVNRKLDEQKKPPITSIAETKADPAVTTRTNKEIAKQESKNEANIEKKLSAEPSAITKKEPQPATPEKKAGTKTDTQSSQPIAEVAKPKENKVIIEKPAIPAASVASRTNIVQQTVYFTADSLQISLYDNGEVDGDTVSVLMNGGVIIPKAGLSTRAVRKTIYVQPDTDSIELIMYAENLGSIAPNTGLLVVHDGKSIYEIRFSGDLKKNSSIILRRRKNLQ